MAYKSADIKVHITGTISKTNGELEFIDQIAIFNDLYINTNERSFKVPRIKILLQDYNYEE